MEIPFVDRQNEVAELCEALASAKSGKGKMYFVTGEIGVGKTRIIEEFCKIAKQEGCLVIFGRCIDSGAVPFLPLNEVLERYMGEIEEQHIPLGLAVSREFQYEQLRNTERERTRMLERYMRKFEEMSVQQPVVFALDDVQWADAGTLSFLHYLSRNISTISMLCVVTYPTEYMKTEGATPFATTIRNINIERNARTIEISRFGVEHVVQILRVMLGTDRVPEKLVKNIYQRTGGNPFYVIEVVREILEQGVFDLEKHELKVPVEEIQMPDTIKNIVSMRVSRLDENTKKVLRACAILGREFEYAPLKALAELDEDTLLDILDNLIAMGFIEEVEGAEERYRFVHNPVYEVIYSELSIPRKRLMHGKAGRELERLHGNEERYHAEIGTHYIRGRELEKGIKYKIRAGEYALSRYIMEDAISNLQDAVAVLGELKDESMKVEYAYRIYAMLGDCNYILSNYDEAIMAYEKALDFSVDETQKTRIKIKMSMPHTKKGNFTESVNLLLDALGHIKEDEFALKADILILLGWTYELKGAFLRAIEYYKQAVEICENTDDEAAIATAHHRLGTGFWCLGDINKAMKHLEKARSIREKRNIKEGLADTYNNLAILYSDTGDIEKAIEYFRKAEKLYADIGELSGLCAIYNNIADIYALKGQYETAIAFYTKDIELSRRIGYKTSEILATNNLASIYQEMENLEPALTHYASALKLSREIGEKRMLTMALANIAIIYAELGEIKKALEFANEALETAKEVGSKEDEGDACSAMGRVLLLSGNFNEAEMYYEKALDFYLETQRVERINTCKFDIGRLYLAWGKFDEAREFLEIAREFFEKMGSSGMLKKVERELSKLPK
jgi:predicted ATPase